MSGKARIINRHLMVEAAKRYAAANNSDPFAYARALSHIRNGIAEYNVFRGKDDVKPGYYDAEESSETRWLPDGTEYQAVVYRNVARV